MTDVALLGIQIETKTAVKAADDLDELALAAQRAENATEDLGSASRRMVPALDGVAKGSVSVGNNSRLMAQQLSQVAQQASATGNWTQALAIQLPDMAMGMGAVGIAAGILASVALPTLVGWLSNTGAQAIAATEALKALGEAQAQTQAEIDKLRLGVAESFQVDLLQELNRLQLEYNSKLVERARLAQSFGTDERALNQFLADNNAELQKIVDRHAEISAALSQQQNRSAQLAVLEGVKAQRAGEMAAKQRETAAEAEKVNTQLRAAGISAETLARMNFANIDQARAFAEGLAGALQAAAGYASFLGSTGQSSGPDAARSLVQFGGPVAMKPSGAGMAYESPKGSGGGGGGGGGGDDLKSFIEDLMSREEQQQASYLRQQEMLQKALDTKLITQQQYNTMLEAAEADHAYKMYEIKQQEAEMVRTAAQGMYDSLGELLGVFATKSRAAAIAQIALNKGLRIAEIIQNTAAAQMRALAELGPIAGAAAAAKIGLMGKIQAGIVAATGIAQAAGTGGGGGGGVGSVRAAAQGAIAPAAPQTRLIVQGIKLTDIITGEMLMDILGKEFGARNITFVR